jgi:hypothetical protein
VLAVNRTLRRLLILKHTQIEMRALLLEFIHLVGKVRKLGSGGGSWHISLLREKSLAADFADQRRSKK